MVKLKLPRRHSAIRRLRLEPEQCLPLPEALAAIRAADVITVGPGSLYTSILPNLLVSRVAAAIGEANATKIFVCNLMTQPGETDGYTARQHLETVKQYAPEIHFDFVVVNNRAISAEQAELYAAEGAFQIGIDEDLADARHPQETEIIRADLLDEGEKVRHNSDRLAQVVAACWEQCSVATGCCGLTKCKRASLELSIKRTARHSDSRRRTGHAHEIAQGQGASRTGWPAADLLTCVAPRSHWNHVRSMWWLVIRPKKSRRRCWQ